MAQNDTSMRAIGPSVSGVSAVKPFASSFKSKKRGKSKRKRLSATSKAACLPPDLDIVSGFAFLSFSTADELECHIEDHEVNTRSLSINVGGKRKKSAPRQQKQPNYTADGNDFAHSKRIKIPSQKILESYATADLNLNKVRPNVPRELKRTKIRPFPGSQATSTNSLNLGSSSSLSSDLKEKYHYFTTPKIDLTAEETNTPEISLECSERISLFDEEEKTKQVTHPSVVSGVESACSTAIGTEVPVKKKKKKRKRDRSIHDQTCQTMFRIKKKKKDFGENAVSSIKSDEAQNESSSSFLRTEEETIKENPISSNFLNVDASSSEITGNEFTECEKVTSGSVSTETDTNVIEVEGSMTHTEEEIYSPPVSHFQTKGPKSLELKVHRLKVSNKVEKIDYCARSGGVSLVERHHERQNKYKQDESAEDPNCGQQLPSWENDSRGSSSCDVNTVADNLSENSGNDSSNNSSYGDQESLMSVKSRIFHGSSSVFISSVDESNDTSDIDIELSEADASKPVIDIVKALPKSYLFGHLSSFPDKTTKGTMDVSIQVYENDIQLYMNYAADFDGRVIKIIVPDNEDSKSSCYLKSSYLSGLPKFLQPQEYVKAVRSATERNRRHTIGDLFQRLKNELFDEVRDYYFSKQAILSKAIEIMEQHEVEGQLLESEKNTVGIENQELRSRLNILLFGEDLEDDKLLDLNKVTEHLKTLGIEVEIPPEEPNKDGKISQESQGCQSDDYSIKQQKKYVTRKGRPPSEGKLLKSLQTDPQPKLPKIPKPRELSNFVRAAFNNKMKEFVAIAPSDNETPTVDQSTSKEAVKTSSSSVDTRDSIPRPATSDALQENLVSDSSVNKIVCNLTQYRIHQQPRSSGALTIVTNPEPLKEIESKNVVHIKISNDTMKQIGVISSISALSSSSKNSVSPASTNDNKQNKQESVGTEQPALCNTKESQETSKPTNKVSTPLDVSRNPSTVAAKCTFDQCKSEALTLKNSENTSVHPTTSKNEVILVKLKEKAHQVDDNQSQVKAAETENIKKSTEGTAEENATSSSKGEYSCPKSDSTNKDVPRRRLEDATVSQEVTIAIGVPVREGLKTISERGSATTTTYIMAKPQCSSQVSVSQTLPQHQSVPAMKKYAAIKPLQGTPLISLAKMQQNQAVLTPHVSVKTADNISIRNKSVAMMKQVVTTKINTPQTLNKIPMTAKSTSSLPVLKMKQLRPAPLATTQTVTLLPMTTTTMATQGTPMLQMKPTALAKVVTSQSISQLPTVTTNVTMITHSTGMVQMVSSIGKNLVTPQNIAVLPLSATMATHSKPNIQITPSTLTKLVTPIQATAAQQSITVLPMGTKVKPIIQVPQAIGSKVAVASPQGISVSSPPVTQPTASGYVALVRTPSPNTPPAMSQKTFIVPNSSLPGTASPFRIVFKPTGQPKVYSAPFPQIKSAIQSSNVIGLPRANTATMHQSNTSVSTSMTTHPTGTLNTKVVFQDKVPVTNKPVSVQNTGNTNNIPVQYRHLIMKTPPLQVVSVSQPPQTKTLVRVQQATPTPILSSISSVSEQPTKPSTPLTGLVHLSSGVKDFVSKPSTTVAVPVQSTASSVRQLLVSGPMNAQERLQDLTKPTSIHPKVHTSVAVGGRSMATFNIAVPQSGSLQNSSPRLVSQGNQDKERGLSETQASQLTPLTTSGSVGSKETFSEIEKILAKIPSPNVTNSTASTSGNTTGFSAPTSILRSNIVQLSCTQNLDYSTRAMNQAVGGITDAATAVHSMDGRVFNSVVRPQQIPDAQNSPLSQMITSSTKSPPFTSVSTRDRIPSNQPSYTNSPTKEVTRSTSVTFSSTCSSTAATYDNPKPKEDKTCSVVDSPEVVSCMVSADTLSVCNIDSSIPDIASELSSQINPASRGFSSLKSTMKEWPGNKETSLPTKETNVKMKTGHDFESQDESTAEDFDLLSTFEWNNNASNESSAVSSSVHPYKTGDN